MIRISVNIKIALGVAILLVGVATGLLSICRFAHLYNGDSIVESIVVTFTLSTVWDYFLFSKTLLCCVVGVFLMVWGIKNKHTAHTEKGPKLKGQ